MKERLKKRMESCTAPTAAPRAQSCFRRIKLQSWPWRALSRRRSTASSSNGQSQGRSSTSQATWTCSTLVNCRCWRSWRLPVHSVARSIPGLDSFFPTSLQAGIRASVARTFAKSWQASTRSAPRRVCNWHEPVLARCLSMVSSHRDTAW